VEESARIGTTPSPFRAVLPARELEQLGLVGSTEGLARYAAPPTLTPAAVGALPAVSK
jgi:hypothetical protein